MTGERGVRSAKGGQATRIFLSYRRDDASGYAGRVAERLCNRFGRDAVFRDLDSISPGYDFTVAINDAIGRCDAVVVVIGRNWLLAARPEGGRRLDDPDDFVRVEIVAALERRVPVIPVLVDRAGMPTPEALPPPLVPLARRNALELSDSRWDYDFQRLIDVLDPASSQTLTGSTPAVVTPRPKRRWWWVLAPGAAALVLGALLVLAGGGGGDNHRRIASSAPTTATTTTTIETTPAVPGGGESAAKAPSASAGPAAGSNPSPGGGGTKPEVPSPSPTAPPPTVTPQPPPPYPSPNADEVAGTWAGQAYANADDTIGYPIRVRVGTGCGVGAKCGSIYDAGKNCTGDLTFLGQTYAGSGYVYASSVSNLTGSSPTCREGPGVKLGQNGDGTLAYWTEYGPWATLSPA